LRTTFSAVVDGRVAEQCRYVLADTLMSGFGSCSQIVES
jgi:hypothetical protein